MKRHEAREELSAYRYLLMEAERAEKRAARWRDKAVSLSPPDPAGMGIRSAGRRGLDTLVSLYVDYADESIEILRKAEDKRRELEAVIDLMDDYPMRALLKLHYIDGMSLTETANALGYSVSWAYKFHKLALDAYAALKE